MLYVGSEHGLESEIIPQAGIKYRAIRCGKFRRYHQKMILNLLDPTTFYQNAKDLINFVKGYRGAKKIIAEYDPDVVFTKGGFVSLPVGLAAVSLGYPLVIHESDSIMGLSNKILARKASRICVSYPTEIYPKREDDRYTYTGNPIRQDIYEGNKERGIKNFQLKEDLPVVMVIGGSQGAFVINDLVSGALDKLLDKYQVIHISGERDYDWLQYKTVKIDKKLQERYHLYNFLSGELKDAYAVADLVISRAGNNIIAELAALSKPTVLIPISNSANNHQLMNGRILSRAGAALMMLQDHLTPSKLVRQIDLLFDSPDDLQSLAEKIHSFAKSDAAELVAGEIIKEATEFNKKEDEQKEKKS